jgi:hypothetical protein
MDLSINARLATDTMGFRPESIPRQPPTRSRASHLPSKP